MRGRKSQIQFTKASEEERESKMNLGSHGREKEIQDAEKCATCEKWNERKGLCGKIKEELEGEHREQKNG